MTIRDRLHELDPNLDELSLYRTRQLVPAAPNARSAARRGVHHQLAQPRTPRAGGRERHVGQGGPRGRADRDESRTIKLGGKDEITEADVRQQALMGAFEIVARV